MAADGTPAGTSAPDAASSGAAAQPEPPSAEAPALTAGVAADQLPGTDSRPTMDAWPRPANTPGPAQPEEPARPTTLCGAAAPTKTAGVPVTTCLSVTEFETLFMTHQAVVFTAPLMVFATIGELSSPVGSTAAAGEASPATALGKLEIT